MEVKRPPNTTGPASDEAGPHIIGGVTFQGLTPVSKTNSEAEVSPASLHGDERFFESLVAMARIFANMNISQMTNTPRLSLGFEPTLLQAENFPQQVVNQTGAGSLIRGALTALVAAFGSQELGVMERLVAVSLMLMTIRQLLDALPGLPSFNAMRGKLHNGLFTAALKQIRSLWDQTITVRRTNPLDGTAFLPERYRTALSQLEASERDHKRTKKTLIELEKAYQNHLVFSMGGLESRMKAIRDAIVQLETASATPSYARAATGKILQSAEASKTTDLQKWPIGAQPELEPFLFPHQPRAAAIAENMCFSEESRLKGARQPTKPVSAWEAIPLLGKQITLGAEGQSENKKSQEPKKKVRLDKDAIARADAAAAGRQRSIVALTTTWPAEDCIENVPHAGFFTNTAIDWKALEAATKVATLEPTLTIAQALSLATKTQLIAAVNHGPQGTRVPTATARKTVASKSFKLEHYILLKDHTKVVMVHFDAVIEESARLNSKVILANVWKACSTAGAIVSLTAVRWDYIGHHLNLIFGVRPLPSVVEALQKLDSAWCTAFFVNVILVDYYWMITRIVVCTCPCLDTSDSKFGLQEYTLDAIYSELRKSKGFDGLLINHVFARDLSGVPTRRLLTTPT